MIVQRLVSLKCIEAYRDLLCCKQLEDLNEKNAAMQYFIRRSSIAVILSIRGNHFTCHSSFSGHVLLPYDPLYL